MTSTLAPLDVDRRRPLLAAGRRFVLTMDGVDRSATDHVDVAQVLDVMARTGGESLTVTDLELELITTHVITRTICTTTEPMTRRSTDR
jgi:hypothetical protein